MAHFIADGNETKMQMHGRLLRGQPLTSHWWWMRHVGLVVAVLEATGTVVLCEARGAADYLAIWTCTVLLKVPDMLSMLGEKRR